MQTVFKVLVSTALLPSHLLLMDTNITSQVKERECKKMLTGPVSYNASITREAILKLIKSISS